MSLFLFCTEIPKHACAYVSNTLLFNWCVHMFRNECAHTDIYIYLSIYPSIYLSVCLSVYLSICLSTYLSIYLSNCICTYIWYIYILCIFLFLYTYVYVHIYLNIHVQISIHMHATIHAHVRACCLPGAFPNLGQVQQHPPIFFLTAAVSHDTARARPQHPTCMAQTCHHRPPHHSTPQNSCIPFQTQHA